MVAESRFGYAPPLFFIQGRRAGRAFIIHPGMKIVQTPAIAQRDLL